MCYLSIFLCVIANTLNVRHKSSNTNVQMKYHVFFHVALIIKSFVTNFTFEWFLSCVNAKMSDHILLQSEYPSTDLTREDVGVV